MFCNRYHDRLQWDKRLLQMEWNGFELGQSLRDDTLKQLIKRMPLSFVSTFRAFCNSLPLMDCPKLIENVVAEGHLVKVKTTRLNRNLLLVLF